MCLNLPFRLSLLLKSRDTHHSNPSKLFFFIPNSHVFYTYIKSPYHRTIVNNPRLQSISQSKSRSLSSCHPTKQITLLYCSVIPQRLSTPTSWRQCPTPPHPTQRPTRQTANVVPIITTPSISHYQATYNNDRIPIHSLAQGRGPNCLDPKPRTTPAEESETRGLRGPLCRLGWEGLLFAGCGFGVAYLNLAAVPPNDAPTSSFQRPRNSNL